MKDIFYNIGWKNKYIYKTFIKIIGPISLIQYTCKLAYIQLKLNSSWTKCVRLICIIILREKIILNHFGLNVNPWKGTINVYTICIYVPGKTYWNILHHWTSDKTKCNFLCKALFSALKEYWFTITIKRAVKMLITDYDSIVWL